jgi:hypothetical protein
MALYFDPNGINLTSFGGKRLNKNKTAVNISASKIEIINDGFDNDVYSLEQYPVDATQIEIGKNAAGNYLNGTIKSFYYFPESVSSEVLKSISLQPQTDTTLPNPDSASIVLKIAIPTPNTVWNIRNMGFVNTTVNWGDSSADQVIFNNTNSYNITTVTPHTYSSAGIYNVTITKNTSQGVRFTFANTEDARRIISIPFIGTQWSWNTIQANDFFDFQGCTNLVNIESFQISGLTSLGNGTAGNGFFRNCTSLESFPFFDASTLVEVVGAWANCSSLTHFPLLNFSNVVSFGGTNQGAWQNCSGLKNFPPIDTSKATSLVRAWAGCSGLTNFPFINTSNCINFQDTWNQCSNLTSFPALDFSKAVGNLGGGSSGQGTWRNLNKITSFPFINISGINGSVAGAWAGCSSLTSFPLLDFSKVTSFGEQNQGAWQSCSSLTTFPSINTSSGTSFVRAWQSCSNLTQFPLLDFSNAVNISYAWVGCSGLTSFPLINTTKVTNIAGTWQSCTGLTSFPLIDTSLVTIAASGNDGAWKSCTGLTTFPLLNLSNCSIFGNTTLGGTWRSCTSLVSFPKIIFSSGTTFTHCWAGCSSLANFESNCFDNTPGTDFTNAWLSCALTAQSIENILVSINTSNKSNGTLGISGGTNAIKSTWTTAANTAYDALIARGWTITFRS